MKIFQKAHRFIVSNIGSSAQKCNYLRGMGARIGKNTIINGDLATFGTEPYLISVGDDCLFAWGVKLITHDGGINVLNIQHRFGDKMADKMGKIIICNNVYIGMLALVLPGVKIGDNTIIGAHSVVTHDIPSGSVAVGISAKVIETVDDYYSKCKDKVYYTAGMSPEDKKEYYQHLITYDGENL